LPPDQDNYSRWRFLGDIRKIFELAATCVVA
jgi:hypothetical protein